MHLKITSLHFYKITVNFENSTFDTRVDNSIYWNGRGRVQLNGWKIEFVKLCDPTFHLTVQHLR